MIFGRRKSKADEAADEPSAVRAAADEAGAVEADEAADTGADDLAATADVDAREADPVENASGSGTGRDWAAFDASRDWREEGPFDVEEVDLEADDVQRLDFGSLIVTPPPGAELRLQVAEGTQAIVSILVALGDSAIELSAFSAPRTPGLWAEIREQIIEQTAAAGGSSDCVEGPFGTELVRNLRVQTPDGRTGFQVTRTWMAEGPRWVLRGVIMGRAAMTNGVDDDVVGPLFDAFSDVIVRRDERPKPVGDLLPLSLPPDATAQRLPS